MKYLGWFLFIIILLFLLVLTFATPFVWIGILIFLFGIYQLRQKRKGKVTFSKPGWIITAGILLSFLLFAIFIEDVEEQVNEEAVEKAIEEDLVNEEKEVEKEPEEANEIEKNIEQEQAEKELQEKELADQFKLEQVNVGRVIDGDTIELKDGRKVRLVGVNTPESTTRTEEYGKEASTYTKSKLDGQQIWIQKDVSDTDRYKRYLRIIWLAIPTDDMDEAEIRQKMFNADLVLNGYAEPSTYPPDVKYSELFVKFAKEARENNTGLWAYGENGTTKGDLDTKEEPPPEPKTTPTPKPRESFKNCTELRKKYPNGVASNHPAYESKHDRDKDNWACER